jgi:hypothetical protein
MIKNNIEKYKIRGHIKLCFSFLSTLLSIKRETKKETNKILILIRGTSLPKIPLIV